jgi:hypothetical protein
VHQPQAFSGQLRRSVKAKDGGIVIHQLAGEASVDPSCMVTDPSAVRRLEPARPAPRVIAAPEGAEEGRAAMY